MIISIALALFVAAIGTLATYIYENNVSLLARLCAGSCIGLAALGLVSFVIACLIGLTPFSIMSSLVLLALPLLILRDKNVRIEVHNDLVATLLALRRGFLQPNLSSVGYAVFYFGVTALLWQAFSRAMIVTPEGIYTGVLNNFGDLPFHLSVITSFAFGNNFPPEDPTYAGVHFTYPFISDFISAVFVRSGANLYQSMFIENIILAVSLFGLIHRWALEMLRDRLAALITPLLAFLNGGFGWVLLWNQTGDRDGGLLGILATLPPSITVIPETTWRWGNAVSALLLPQRGILLGLPLAVIVFTQWWIATTADAGREHPHKNKKKTSPKSPQSKRPVTLTTRMYAAGAIAGLLPLVHAHTFVVVMAMAGCLALIQWRWRLWAPFFLVALVIAGPQLLWSTLNSSVDATRFFEWHFGWDRGDENALWFWLKNTGLFIPLILIALLWTGKKGRLIPRKLLLFYLPFTLCFIVPNIIKMAPWVWDNIKVLYYWWLASAPLVALLLSHLWRRGKATAVLAVVLLIGVTLAGALDVAAILTRPTHYQIFDRSGIEFAEVIKQQTDPRALIVHAPVHNHPSFLTGRRSLMGYPGHIWTHGLDFVPREAEIKRIFAGAPDAALLLSRHGIEYAVLGPHERNQLRINEQFFSTFRKVGEAGDYSLYKVSQP